MTVIFFVIEHILTNMFLWTSLHNSEFNFQFPGQGIQNIQQQMLGQMGGIAGQPMVQYQPSNQQVYQQTLGLQQVK